MPFRRENIDRAIVTAQFGLRGRTHPLAGRLESPHPKSLEVVTRSLIAHAADDATHVDYYDKAASFDDYLAMCQQLALACDDCQIEALQLILQEILHQNAWMRVEVATGEREPSEYLLPLRADNRWGRTVLALAQAFQVPVAEEQDEEQDQEQEAVLV